MEFEWIVIIWLLYNTIITLKEQVKKYKKIYKEIGAEFPILSIDMMKGFEIIYTILWRFTIGYYLVLQIF